MIWLTMGDRMFVVLLVVVLLLTVALTISLWLPVATQLWHDYRKSVDKAIEDSESIDRE